jgi:hypothetical protein
MDALNKSRSLFLKVGRVGRQVFEAPRISKTSSPRRLAGYYGGLQHRLFQNDFWKKIC